MLKKNISLVLLIVVLQFKGFTQIPTASTFPDPSWDQIWVDNFPSMNISGGYAGHWLIDNNGTHGNEPQIFMSNNVSITPDGLRMVIKKEEIAAVGKPFLNYHYSSGNMVRWNSSPDPPQYGYLEITSKISNTYGIWPAFWTWVEEKQVNFVGSGGKFYRYNHNQGSDVASTTVNASVTFNSVFFTDKDNGYAVGDLGKIYKTTDKGITWSAYTSGTTVFKGVCFYDLNNGFAVGSGGVILKTANQGTNWAAVTNPAGSGITMNSICFPKAKNGFVDDNVAYAVGTSGKIIKSTDSGNSWSLTTAGTQNLNSVYFVNDDLGYAVGNAGTIYKTTNGSTWNPQSSGTAVNLNGVYFKDENYGVAVGESGKVLTTINGGANWTVSTVGTSNFKSVSGLKEIVYIAGTTIGGIGAVYCNTDIKTHPLTWNQVTNGVPASNFYGVYFNYDYDEIDAYEMVPGNRWKPCSDPNNNGLILSNTIGTANNWISGMGMEGCNNITGGPIYINDFSNGFHTYGVEWSPSKLTYYNDGVAVKSVPNYGYDPVTNNGGMINQKTNILIGLALANYVKWDSDALWPNTSNNPCNGQSIGAGIYNPCDPNYANYFVSGGAYDVNPVYPGYNSGSNPQYTANTTSNPNSYPYHTIQKVAYYKLKNSVCSTQNDLLNSTALVNANASNVKKTITVSGGTSISPVTNTVDKVLRASDFILFNGDFNSGAELFLDVNPCY